MEAQSPRFPLTVRFSDGEECVLESRSDVECELEWMRSDDPDDPFEVRDAEGRPVRLVVEALQIQVLELLEPDGASAPG